MTDDDLMAAVAQGDERAYQEIVRQHIKSISHYAYRMLGNDKDCEDITQETFLRLWLHAQRWQPEKSRLTTWLHRIAHNLCVDLIRKSVNLDYVETIIESAEADEGTDTLEQKQRMQLLQKTIASLPELQRSALMLCHYQNFSNKEAADIMEISVKAVESALSRARKTLRETLADYLPGMQT